MWIKNCAVLFLCLVLLKCSQPSSPEGNENQYKIYLIGRVLNKEGKPMPNTIARLIGKNLSDTTDANGFYAIIEKAANSSLKKVIAEDTLDSLQIIKESQVITIIDITKWIDTLPDIFVIQRDIYGDLSLKPKSFSAIKAIIKGDNIPDSAPKIAEIWYNEPNQSYSGFVYFVYSSQLTHYSVYVNVYNKDSIFIGRSVKIDFPSTAGDIDIPPFDPNNSVPIINVGNDTTVSINDTIWLHPIAVDSFGGKIIKWEWSINGGDFTLASKGDTNIIAPADSNPEYRCVVRATDDDGNAATDSMKVKICKDVPTVKAGNDTIVSINDTIRLSASATDAFGKIIKWEWSINSGNFALASKGDTNIIAPADSNPEYRCVVRATDDDGNAATDSMKVTVYKDVPKAYACNDTFISIDSCLTLKGNVTQSFGFIKKYFWDFEGDGIWDDSSTTTSEVIHSYTTLGDKVVIFGAMDDDGNLSKDTLQVLVGTFLEGAISGNETLTKNQNPFILTGAVTVPSGSQLTIEPGAILLYSKSTILHIDGGAVIANGTPSDSISFSSLFKDDNITFLFFEKADLSKSQLSYLKFVGHDIWIDNIFIYCEKAPNQPIVAVRIGNESESQQVSPKNSGVLNITNMYIYSSQITTDGYDTPAKIRISNSLIDSSIINGTYPRSEPIELDSCVINNSAVKSDSYNKGITINQCTGVNKKLVVCCCGASVTVDGKSYSNPDNDCKIYDF